MSTTRQKYDRRKAARKEAARRMRDDHAMLDLYLTLTYKSRRWWRGYAFYGPIPY